MPNVVSTPWERWRLEDYPYKLRYDAWINALAEACSGWDVNKIELENFNAEIKMAKINKVQLVNFRSDPCKGQRSKSVISKSSNAYYTFDIVRQGQQILTIDGKSVAIERNQAILWDSDRRMDFNFPDKIEKVMLRIPHDYLHSRFPRIDEFVGQKIELYSGIGKMTADHILSLLKNYNNNEDKAVWDSTIDLSLDLIINCLAAKLPLAMSKSRNELLTRIKNYICNNLDDPNLTPNSISEKFYISNRYLHMLFKDEGITVTNYIKMKRLEQCRREIMRIGLTKERITDIALRWGFSDSANFCRTFKSYYGYSPREYQKQICSCSGVK